MNTTTQSLNNDDFKRVMTILFDVWEKAGDRARAEGLTGTSVTRAQENTMTAFLAHIDKMRKERAQ